MVEEQTKQKLVFNGGTILSALENSKISPENFFGTNLQTITEVKKEVGIDAEIEAFCLMNPMRIENIGGQSFKLVRTQWGGERN